MGNTISEVIRDEIERRGLTYAAVAKLADLDPAQVRRFILKERGLNSEAIDKLGNALGLRLSLPELHPAERDVWMIKAEHDGAITQIEEMIERLNSVLKLAKRFRPKEDSVI